MRNIKAIAFDLDKTLAYISDEGRGLAEIFKRHGLPPAAVDGALASMNVIGFTFENFMKALEAASGKRFGDDWGRLLIACKRWVGRVFRLYPDALPALRAWQEAGVPIAIVTAGDQAYQEQKVGLLGILYDRIYVVPEAREKYRPLRLLVRDFGVPILFVDDQVPELDAVRTAGLVEDVVTTVHLARSNGRQAERSAPHAHIQSLTELSRWIPR